VTIYLVGRISQRYQSAWFDQRGEGRLFYWVLLLLVAGAIAALICGSSL
jgi:hypothetical protein